MRAGGHMGRHTKAAANEAGTEASRQAARYDGYEPTYLDIGAKVLICVRAGPHGSCGT